MSITNPLEGCAPSSFSFRDTDDGLDHTASIIARMRGVHGLPRSPGETPAKPRKSRENAAEATTGPLCANIGKRVNYSRNICIAIYQLVRSGSSSEMISQRIGIPIRDVNIILKHATEMQQSAYRRVMQMSDEAIPSTETIINRMARESNTAMTVSHGRKRGKK